jgi:hypothetical protein
MTETPSKNVLGHTLVIGSMSGQTPTRAAGALADTLADNGEAIGGDQPVVDLLDRVVRSAHTLLGYDFCAVFPPDHNGASLIIVGSHGLSADYVAQVNTDQPVLLDVHSAEEVHALLIMGYATLRAPRHDQGASA